jgi:hypothetical protein
MRAVSVRGKGVLDARQVSCLAGINTDDTVRDKSNAGSAVPATINRPKSLVNDSHVSGQPNLLLVMFDRRGSAADDDGCRRFLLKSAGQPLVTVSSRLLYGLGRHIN